jgi:hypothetical protein
VKRKRLLKAEAHRIKLKEDEMWAPLFWFIMILFKEFDSSCYLKGCINTMGNSIKQVCHNNIEVFSFTDSSKIGYSFKEYFSYEKVRIFIIKLIDISVFRPFQCQFNIIWLLSDMLNFHIMLQVFWSQLKWEVKHMKFFSNYNDNDKWFF